VVGSLPALPTVSPETVPAKVHRLHVSSLALAAGHAARIAMTGVRLAGSLFSVDVPAAPSIRLQSFAGTVGPWAVPTLPPTADLLRLASAVPLALAGGTAGAPFSLGSSGSASALLLAAAALLMLCRRFLLLLASRIPPGIVLSNPVPPG